MIIQIGQLYGYSEKDIGGKAYHLCKLKDFGFNVPNGFILTNDWFKNPSEKELLSYLKNDTLYAIRSSAVDEDGPSFSFAGLQDTYLNVEFDDIYEMVIKCYKSQWNERANSYREKYGLDKSSSMSVIVQEMVKADFVGVMFTQHPLTNRIDEIAIESIKGLGEDLVSGVKIPSSYIIDKKSAHVKSKETHDIKLSEHHIKELCIAGSEIESFYKSSQDIEWAFHNEKLYILQSRPITTTFIVPKSKFLGKRIYLSFGHIQNMTRPFTPVGAEMVKELFKVSPSIDFSDYLLYNGSYIYIDITELALLKNFAYEKFRTAISNINNEIPELIDQFRDMEKRRTSINLTFVLFLLPKLLKIFAYLKGKKLDAKKIDQLAEKHIDKYRKTTSLEELISIRSYALINTFKLYLPIVFTGIISYKKLHDLFIKWDLDMDDFHALLSGVDGNKTTEMGLLYGDLIDAYGNDEFDDLLDNYLKIYGMRVEGEIDLGRKRAGENIDAFLEILKSNVSRKANISPRDRHKEYKEKSIQVEMKLKSQLHASKWRKLKKHIDLMQSFIVYREHPKYTIMNIFAIYRRYIDSPFITFEEKLNNGLSKEEIKAREYIYDSNIGKMPPLILLSNAQIMQSTLNQQNEGSIKAFGVSSGIISGKVRIIKEIGDDTLREGEILVTQFTDPGWTTTMARASGLIIEVGGMMTHGAVVAREYGIPAIVGVKNASSLLKTGDMIKMDGSSGVIEFLNQ